MIDLFCPFFSQGNAAKMRDVMQSAAEPLTLYFCTGAHRAMEMTRKLHGGDPWAHPSGQICAGVTVIF